MCTVAEICSTGVRVTLSDVPEVLLTATNSEPPVQDAGLAAKAGTLFDGIGAPDAVFIWGARAARVPARPAAYIRRVAAAPPARFSPH
ncbi:hypothetical protein C0Z18_29745 [Trinickia dabaoshanensis]|uniref:Uncharacterized protein n=1 Tax=Trinickia dabaoshanensis TaxID=564714 RepID=A0A2N7VCA4_9BURK|nr:hypothetical protein C0Z18_29745 [Trinickia dabaoshanensis]